MVNENELDWSGWGLKEVFGFNPTLIELKEFMEMIVNMVVQKFKPVFDVVLSNVLKLFYSQ